jgi:MFS family permease
MPPTPAPDADTHPARWRTLALLAVAELLGMSLWFAASAVSPQYRALWGSHGRRGGVADDGVNLGFVAGTAASALLNLADVVPARRLFALAAVAGAAANALVLAPTGYAGALAWRFATGVCLAGVYPPAMKMIATWFRARRGLAVGTVVGALTVGKALPYLVHAIPGAGIRPVALAASAGALGAAALVWFGYRDGPYPFPSRPFSWGLVGDVVRQREWRLATGGYLGHMLELYSAWTWLPVFHRRQRRRARPGRRRRRRGRRVGRRLRRPRRRRRGVRVGRPRRRPARPRATRHVRHGRQRPVRARHRAHLRREPVAARPDRARLGLLRHRRQRAVLGARHRERAAHAVGTALTLQTSLGFLLTAITIQLVPLLAGAVGWRWAFPALAVGPALGIWSIRRLVAYRRAS